MLWAVGCWRVFYDPWWRPVFPETKRIPLEWLLRLLYSAEFEITVNLLIQVDKLVQLIESPVFTCTGLFLPPSLLFVGSSLSSDLDMPLIQYPVINIFCLALL